MARRLIWMGAGVGTLLCALSLRTTPAPDAPVAPETTAESCPFPTDASWTPLASSPAIHLAPEVPLASGAVFRTGERLVRVTDPDALPQLVADHGVHLASAPGRSGYALVRGEAAQLDALSTDPRVADAAHNGVTFGASQGSLRHMQWHLEQIDAAAPPSDVSDFVVAVLDTGVAYESAVRDGVAYAAAPSLAGSPIVAPADLVNHDDHANDDHQHGTHIASLIASSGSVDGVAAGVSLMPVKVLDHENSGTELGLVEGIHHAIAHGADVINMSLSFGEGYQPSRALREALRAAADAGVVMVAAAGNDGSDLVSWPAASPHVIAVGASRPDPSSSTQCDRAVSQYSNINADIDVVAPGGDLTADLDKDGWVDGILAQTIDPADPTAVGFWMMAGTSQAAALVSGAAVHLLADGIPPHEVYATLQHTSLEGKSHRGLGGGFLDLAGQQSFERAEEVVLYASLLPYIKKAPKKTLHPSGLVTVFDEAGEPVEGAKVLATIWGNGDRIKHCITRADGSCNVRGSRVPKLGSDGSALPWAWTVAVQGIDLGDGIVHRPRPAMTATPALQSLIASIDAHADLSDAMLAWSFQFRTEDPDLGKLEDGYSVVDSGSGLASIPLGVMMTPPLFESLGRLQGRTVSADGLPVEVSLMELDGSGLASIPLGIRGMRLLTLDGSGLASIPLGVRAFDAYGGGRKLLPLGGTGFASIPLGLQTSPLGTRISSGGWQVDGFSAATALGTSSRLAIAPVAALDQDGIVLDGSGAGVLRVE